MYNQRAKILLIHSAKQINHACIKELTSGLRKTLNFRWHYVWNKRNFFPFSALFKKFRLFGRKKNFTPKKSLKSVLHKAIQLLTILGFHFLIAAIRFYHMAQYVCPKTVSKMALHLMLRYSRAKTRVTCNKEAKQSL